MKLIVSAIVLGLLVIVGSQSFFIVNEPELAVKLRLGEIKRTDYLPGLHLKLPFIENVRKFSRRIMTLDENAERFLTSEKKNMIVDFFVQWRINDSGLFYQAMGGSTQVAMSRLSQIVKDGLRDEFGARTVQESISDERKQIMQQVRDFVAGKATPFGIEIIDVRIKRIELPEEVSNSVFRRMEKERATVAKTFRSEGQQESKGITANAERQVEEILAEAYREAETIRGEGDAQAAETYAKAYGQDAEFYSLYRSLNAYRNVFNNRGDVLVVEPDSEFFRFFKNPLGRSTEAP